MNIAGLVLLGAGYLLGSPTAREKFFSGVQQLAGQGIDALNKMSGGEADVSKADTDTPTK